MRQRGISAIFGTLQWLAMDREIRYTSAGCGDPAGADCGLLIMIVSRFSDDLK
jgi:xanthine dehydrogenase iron-sulfur cluster and FAD-binding subunit A